MSDLIRRDPDGAAEEVFDLIVVGGGIHGIMVALEATRRRLRPLLLERADFAGATSHNSLRILHGGLRYLQSLDLGRALQSIAERAWWLRNFPELVEPLPCLMPLYGDGLLRADVMRAALTLNDLLRRARVGAADARLGRSRVVSPEAVVEAWPGVAREGLAGGALWHDLWAPAAPRLCIEALRWACQAGATALNHVEAVGFATADGRISGVEAVDLVGGHRRRFRAPLVIAAAGPWTAGLFDASTVARQPQLLAWNLLLERRPLSALALAVRARRPGAQTFFVVPLGDRVLAGTAYASEAPGGRPTARAHRAFIDGLNEAAPGLDVTEADVGRVFAGKLPAAGPAFAAPADRPSIIDAARQGGPAGLFVLSGVKLTTARAVADRALRIALPRARARPLRAFDRPRRAFVTDEAATRRWLRGEDLDALRRIAAEEAVVHLDDLILRRTLLGDRPAEALRLAGVVSRAFGFDVERTRQEIARVRSALALPPRPRPAWLGGGVDRSLAG